MEAHWTDRLSDYLDGELGPVDRAAADRHLAECSVCAEVLSDLRALAASARQLPDVPPERDLWPGIRDRLPAREPVESARAPAESERTPVIPLAARRRVVMSVPQLIAAGLALMLFTASAVWLTVGETAPEPMAVATEAPPDAMLAAYDPAMSDLEAEYERRRDQLDPETIRVVERNLAIIDVAIHEAREALAADPSSGFLNAHLAETVRRRMSLLKEVASI